MLIKITIGLAIVISLVSLAEPLYAAKDVKDGLNSAANTAFTKSEGGVTDLKTGITSIPGAIGKIIGLALQFIGLAFFVLMVYGGFIWMFARGNDQDVQKAKDLIQSAIIGLIIVLSAYALTLFIGNALTSSSPVITGGN